MLGSSEAGNGDSGDHGLVELVGEDDGAVGRVLVDKVDGVGLGVGGGGKGCEREGCGEESSGELHFDLMFG